MVSASMNAHDDCLIECNRFGTVCLINLEMTEKA